MRQAGNVSHLPAPRPGAPTTGAPDPVIARWLQRTLTADPPRARSLVVTVWGDALAPHGGEIWLAALIRLLAPLGINERLTRTSVFRLARDGWVEGQAHGRRSRYRLTRGGRQRFEAAYRRIYAPPLATWSGEWEVVIDPPGDGDAQARQRRRDELRWEGFGTLAPGCFVRPRAHGATAPLDDDPASRDAAAAPAMDATAAPHAAGAVVLHTVEAFPASLAGRVGTLWDLGAVADGYRRFLALFGGVIERFRMRDIAASDPAQCFAVRTLLIHAFRRVLLRDPRLPATLLPLDWPGAAAYALTRDFYRLTLARAEAHLAATYAAVGDALPPADISFGRRFGGLLAP